MSIGILVDSCMIIDHFRSRDKSATRYTELLKRFDRFFISVTTEYEILNGLNDLHQETWEDILGDLEVLVLGRSEIRIASRINRELKSNRQQLDLADIFIAATALANDLPLATLNRKHFERIGGLKLVDNEENV